MKRILKRLFCLAIAVVMLMSTAGAEGTSTYMAYRSNAVTISAADGLGIVSGTFVIKDLSITNGQDPDGRNYVGQVHTLENGEFTFSVGRSASESVASWFNSKISGYNDPSVNGDRTTFDQTADDLNFAFVGDLNLVVDTADDPQGLSVTFPDVVIAQGSTLFRNNWWFGQHSGQHTRDSDGPDTVLAIGSTTEGRTVYASFLRGGNEVNEISLEAIHVVEAAADSANKVVDVKNKFAALPIDGVQSNLEGFPGSYDPTVNHIQGYAQYDSCDHTRYSILTHSVGTAPYAHIVAGPKTGSDKWGFKTYLQNWKHPGGVQVMGDYLLVPSEQDASAHIALYDLRSLAVKELRRVETFDLAVSHKAGALGITSYEDKNGIEYYVMIVAHLDGENTVYHVYRALASNGIENARFSEVGSFESDKDFQGFGLITEDGTNDIYMIGLWSPSEGVTFADYAYLYQLNTETWTIGEALQQIHMVSVGGMAGMMGVHFRYGANVYVADDGTLTLSATERNSVLGSSLATNDWIPAIVN